MKTKLTTIALLLTLIVSAQKPERFNGFVSIEQDVKMAYQGAHGEGGVLNPEIKIGFEWDHIQIWVAYEWLTQIRYQKGSMGVDYKFHILNPEKFTTSLGIEIGSIHRVREFQNTPGLYRSNESNWSGGVNATFVWWLNKRLGVSANYNAFTPEKHDNLGNRIEKNFRQDVRVGFTYRFGRCKQY